MVSEDGATFRIIKINMEQTTSEGFGNLPNASANFGNVPQGSEEFRMMRNHAERTEQHTLTVRETARLFEEAGVPRTERSIINWCQPNRQGIARLDAFFDSNERKYFITPQSATLAIREEQAKSANNGTTPNPPVKEIPNPSEPVRKGSADLAEMKDLELKIRDLEITNRVKDQFIGMLEKERVEFQKERQGYVERLISSSRELGQLHTQLTMLGSGQRTELAPLRHDSEDKDTLTFSDLPEQPDNGFDQGFQRGNGATNSQQQIL